MTNVKQMNRSYVLQLLLSKGAMSRTDLANELNLTTATLTSICNEFIQRGLIIQLDASEQHISGRKKYPLKINSTYKYVVAISLHYNGNVIAITDLLGKLVAIEPFVPEANASPEVFFHDVASACIRMLWEHQISAQDVLGAGVCTIGPVDQSHGIALHPFKIFNQTNVPIQDLLSKELPFPVCVESNVCSFLTAEQLFGTATSNNLLAIKWGPGVGSASSISGVICKDKGHYSAEVGHTFFYQNQDRICKCGRRGCLETGVGLPSISEVILSSMEQFSALQHIRDCYGPPNIENINQYIEADCPPVQDFVRQCAHDLAVGVNNAMQVFPPDQVILYGPLFECDFAWNCFLEHIRYLNPGNHEKRFFRSSLENQVDYIGPAAIAIKTFLLEPGGA